MNVTFYRFPKLEFFQSWYERSPDDFTFSVKAPRIITHYKRFNDAQLLIHNFYERINEGLREKAGCVLFQFPASFIFDQEALDHIIKLLDKSFNNVLEFRHASWWQDRVFKTLEQNGIIFCGTSHPNLPKKLIRTADTVYYRFHGIPKLYYSQYETDELRKVANEISEATHVRQACVYFNNTAKGAAISNAKQFQGLAISTVLA